MNLPERRCWHCGEALPPGIDLQVRIAGQMRAMCCMGCRAAAEWIEHLGLEKYYTLRTAPGIALSDAATDAVDTAWLEGENARHVVRDLGAGLRESLLLVEGIHCTACVWLIERALGAMPGIVAIQVNAASRRARVVWREPETTLARIVAALPRIGFRARPLDAKGLDDARRDESRTALKRLLVAAFGAMQAMMYAPTLYLGAAADAPTRDLLRWFGFLVATPVVFYSAKPFLAGALRSLRAGQLGMDVPVAFAIITVYAASLLEALRGSGEVYFDSISMFVFFLLAGRYLEMRARHRAGDLTDALARLAPPFAERQEADGTLRRVAVHTLRIGDCVHVAEGGIVPADGTLLDAQCSANEALLSGESAPVRKQRGDVLIAGSILERGPVRMRVARVGADTALACVTALVGRAQAERPRLARVGERAAGRFVACVLALTTVVAIAWSVVDPSRALTASVAVLVISCPCAFALAVPVAITRAVAALAQHGVLVVKPDAIQDLAGCTHVLFDKTGTLTDTTLSLSDVVPLNGIARDDALRMAAALARRSRHPIARAIAAAHADQVDDALGDVVSHAGLGISATLDGRTVRLGRSDFALGGLPVPMACDDAVVLADDAGAIAAFRLSESVRADARAAIAALQQQGMTVSIASGDAPERVAEIAQRLGVSEWRARQSPADKVAWMAALRATGARVVAVGDGVNDAPVLAGADVGIALAEGAELAQASSDIVLARGRLDVIAPARDMARQTLAIVRQNQRWALFYNFAAMPLAALGFVPPWLAAFGMALSSFGVVLNTWRIDAINPPAHDARAALRRRWA
ncbi:cation-transporting P-type ATPase [Lysobacter helvus]|uniref:Cation-transporting P-type ATPase n=2 Tax=Lysobacteraceae TaxID=32033 RepID=A0ABN6G1B9_9GAMM|nr:MULTISPECIES: heavy metal translocating P-type ATPase [Lysobacter]BCT93737.1 cation-transporting P-type ATPase [Lysobacter caseinilyticus]BCT96893.1 cation-transporting P-type ATPase [Lysobacter helvus]